MEDINIRLENEALRKEFVIRNLDLNQIFRDNPEDAEYENKRMLHILDWVNKYNELKSREKMEKEGYLYPPVDPDLDPDNDWYMFERWINGLPVRKTLWEHIKENYEVKDPDTLNDCEIETEWELFKEAIHEAKIEVGLHETIPARLQYKYMLGKLEQLYEITFAGGWVIDGCSGCCPECMQRPWCDSGQDCCWPEDEKAGEIFYIDEVRKYVSPSPVSLGIISDIQQKFDADMEKRMKEIDNNKGERPYCKHLMPF